MGLRLYLRGLGIGVIVTALLMGYSLGGKKELSDAEIRSRAEALGMVEESKVLVKPEEKDGQEDAADPGIPETDASKEDTGSPITITGDADITNVPENETTDTEEDAADTKEDASDIKENTSDTVEGTTDTAGPDKDAENEPADKPKDPEIRADGTNGGSTRELNVSGAVEGTENTEKTEADTGSETDKKTGSDTGSETGKETETDTGSETDKKTGSDTVAETDKKTGSDAGTKTEAAGRTDPGTGTGSGVKTVTIMKGSDSLTAAKELERAGLIENAAAFDEYLVSEKLDRLISSGSYRIPVGAGDQEIARIITGR